MNSRYLTILLILLFLPTPSFTDISSNLETVSDRPGYTSTPPFQDLLKDTFQEQIESYPQLVLEKSLGGQSIVLLLVYFIDKEPIKSKNYIIDLVNISLNNYFQEVSYGKVYFQTVKSFGWYRLSNSMSYYADRRQKLVSDALKLPPRGSIKDFDRVIIVHAGHDRALSHNEGDIWSFASIGYGNYETSSGIVRISISVESEFDPLGVYAHESGHMFGLPDLYGEEDQTELVGIWDLMALGASAGEPPGSKPFHPTSWSKIRLRWITQDSIFEVDFGFESTVTIDILERSPKGKQVLKIPLTSKTYYLVEARKKIGFDSGLPSSGVLILFINDTASGYGSVSVVDTHPETPTLDDAPLNINERYEDFKYGVAIVVVSSSPSNYEVVIQFKKALDLKLVKIWIEPVQPVADQRTVFYGTILNSGSEDASNFSIKVYLDGELYVEFIRSLPAGGSIEVQIKPWRASSGEHVVRWVLDEENVFFEYDETNNVEELRFTVDIILTIKSSYQGIKVWVDRVAYITGADGSISITTKVGSHTIEAESPLKIDEGARRIFTQWSDKAKENPRQINLTSNMILKIFYTNQYYLFIETDFIMDVKGEGWYDEDSRVSLSLDYAWDILEHKMRRILRGYEIDDGPWIYISDNEMDAYLISIIMNRSHTIHISSTIQYYLTVQSQYLQVQGEGWYDQGAEVTLHAPTITEFKNKTRLVFTKWSGDVSTIDQTVYVTMDSAKNVVLETERQYQITIFFFDSRGEKSVTPSLYELSRTDTEFTIVENSSDIWILEDKYLLSKVVWEGVDVKPEKLLLDIDHPKSFRVNLKIYDISIRVTDILGLNIPWAKIVIKLVNGTTLSYTTEWNGSTHLSLIPLGIYGGEASFLGQRSIFTGDAANRPITNVNLFFGPVTLAIILFFIIVSYIIVKVSGRRS